MNREVSLAVLAKAYTQLTYGVASGACERKPLLKDFDAHVDSRRVVELLCLPVDDCGDITVAAMLRNIFAGFAGSMLILKHLWVSWTC